MRPLAVPATLSLALGGVLLASAPAIAAPVDPLVVLSPIEGSTPEGRTLTVRGTGYIGGIVLVADEDDFGPIGVRTRADGTWSVPISYSPDAATAQTIVVTQTGRDRSLTGESVTVNFTLPAAVPVDPQPLVVDSPTDGSATESRRVDFTETATVGSYVAAYEGTVPEQGLPVGWGYADENGEFRFDAFFPPEGSDDITVVVTATARKRCR